MYFEKGTGDAEIGSMDSNDRRSWVGSFEGEVGDGWKTRDSRVARHRESHLWAGLNYCMIQWDGLAVGNCSWIGRFGGIVVGALGENGQSLECLECS